VLKPGDQGAAVESLKQGFRTYGYGVAEGPAFDAEMAAVVRAFPRHFRLGLVDGIADPSTVRTLDRLLVALPPERAR
jgi:N-acetylmuramoyl-L-alanine amidase